MQIELLYFTVIHTCDHVGCIPYRKNDPNIRFKETRTIYADTACKVCAELYEREKEHRAEMAARAAEQRAVIRLEQQQRRKHYLIDGQIYTVIQDKAGYWRGRRRENGHTIQKHFGKTDPRPMLQEVEV